MPGENFPSFKVAISPIIYYSVTSSIRRESIGGKGDDCILALKLLKLIMHIRCRASNLNNI